MKTTIPSFPGSTAVDVSGRLNTFGRTETDWSTVQLQQQQFHDARARGVRGGFRARRADFKAAFSSDQVSDSVVYGERDMKMTL